MITLIISYFIIFIDALFRAIVIFAIAADFSVTISFRYFRAITPFCPARRYFHAIFAITPLRFVFAFIDLHDFLSSSITPC
jgi:hypothetical protein